jgi:hypothetical protein
MNALTEAKLLVDEILEMTKALVLTGEKGQEEDEVDAYAVLLEEREPMVNQLTALRQQLDAEALASGEFEEIKQVIAEITGLDKRHIKFMEHLRKDVQASYKEVKQGQRIHAGYNPLPGTEASSVFDIKQ